MTLQEAIEHLRKTGHFPPCNQTKIYKAIQSIFAKKQGQSGK